MGKHSTGKYAKFKKGKLIATLTIVIILILVIALVVIMTSKTNLEKEPERVLNEAFTGLKELDKEKVNAYMDYDKLIKSLDEMILENPDDTELEKELFKDMKWTIESTKLEDNHAIMIIEMTNKDFKTILTEWMREIVSEREKNQVTNELALQILKKVISDESIKEKTVLKKVNIQKDDSGWKISVDNNLRDLLFPGIDSVISAIKEQ